MVGSDTAFLAQRLSVGASGNVIGQDCPRRRRRHDHRRRHRRCARGGDRVQSVSFFRAKTRFTQKMVGDQPTNQPTDRPTDRSATCALCKCATINF